MRLGSGVGHRLGTCNPLIQLVPEVGVEPTRF